MKNVLLLSFSFFTIMLSAQTKVIFKYDDSGNQVYRGTDPNVTTVNSIEQPDLLRSMTEQTLSEEDMFWLQVRLYPVPVKDILTIDWNEDVDQMIGEITLYQHSTLSNLFTKQNFPNLNRKVQINMSGFYPGVYVLSFKLKDGRTLSKNIVKQ